MSKSKNTRKNNSRIFILALILLVPGFLYIALNRFGANEYVSLPIFGDKVLSGKMNSKMGREFPDTIFHTIDTTGLLNHKGEHITFLEDDTAMSVVHLFYTQDQSFSRLMLNSFEKLSNRFQHSPTVRFYSISVDSSDSSKILADFVKPYMGLENLKWQIASKPTSLSFKYFTDNLLIDAMIDPIDSTKFIVGNQIILVDSRRRIRGFYDIGLKGEMDRLEDEIRLQLIEEIRNNKIHTVEKQL